MNKYVKIKCKLQGLHDNWFLSFEGGATFEFHKVMNKRLLETIWYSHSDKTGLLSKIKLAALNGINYNEVYGRYRQPLLIRPNGSYMTLSSREEIVETTYCKHFPTTSAEIVICENSKNAENFWVKYLQSRYPDKSIKVINFFSTRSLDYIKSSFKGAKIVTFSTTFTDYDWFDKMVICLSGQKILGYSHSDWNILELYPEIEVEIAKLAQ